MDGYTFIYTFTNIITNINLLNYTIYVYIIDHVRYSSVTRL